MINRNNISMIPGGALALGANAATNGFSVLPGTLASIQAAWTGAPVGNFALQVSNDPITPNPDTSLPTQPTNWSTYTGTTVAAGGGAGNWLWQVPAGFAFVQLIYTSTSGSGSLTSVQLVTKG